MEELRRDEKLHVLTYRRSDANDIALFHVSEKILQHIESIGVAKRNTKHRTISCSLNGVIG